MSLVFHDKKDDRLEYAAIPNFNENVCVLKSGAISETDTQWAGLSLGLDTVETVKEAEGRWLLVNEKPTIFDDGTGIFGEYYLYYIGIIDKGTDSPVFLDSVTMNPSLTLKNVKKVTTFYENDKGSGWKQELIQDDSIDYDYSDSKYTLNIDAVTVQATKGAVESVMQGSHETVIHYLVDQVANPDGYDASDDPKKILEIVPSGKKKDFAYTPIRSEKDGKDLEPGQWFMSFTDMLPGCTYKDRLSIKNKTADDARVYLHLVPRNQSHDPRLDQLLNKIEMKVTYYQDPMPNVNNGAQAPGVLIYDGAASGLSVKTKVPENGAEYEYIQTDKLLPLAYVQAKQSGRIEVELYLDAGIQLDKETGTYEYSDLLTKIDWEFMIQGVDDDPDRPGGRDPDKPGGRDPRTPGDPGNPPTVEIGDGDVPLSYMIPDEEVPLSSLLPKTGDTGMVYLFGAIAAISFLILLESGMALKKKK